MDAAQVRPASSLSFPRSQRGKLGGWRGVSAYLKVTLPKISRCGLIVTAHNWLELTKSLFLVLTDALCLFLYAGADGSEENSLD